MKEQAEGYASDLVVLLGQKLKEKLEAGGATAAELRVALDYVRHHGVSDNPSRPGSPVPEVARALPPFESVDQEIE